MKPANLLEFPSLANLLDILSFLHVPPLPGSSSKFSLTFYVDLGISIPL